MTLVRIVEGPVAALGIPTVDNRRLEVGALSVRSRVQRMVELDMRPTEVQLPLMGIDKPGPDHSGSRIIGTVTRVWASNNWVRIEGTADSSVSPGSHACGIDLSQVSTRLNWLDNPRATVTEEELRNDTHRPLLQTITRARLVGVTLYLPGSTAQPGFTGAVVTVR